MRGRASDIAVRRASWAIVLGTVLAVTAYLIWGSHPDRAGVIQVLFPLPLAVVGAGFIAMIAANIAWLIFKPYFDIRFCALLCIISIPLAWLGALEEIPLISTILPQLSTTFVQVMPIPILIAIQILSPKRRTIDRLIFAGLGGVIVVLNLLFHFTLTIPEAELSRQRQSDLLELLADQPPAATLANAISHGGVLLEPEIIAHPEDHVPLPAQWGNGAPTVFANIRKILADAPDTTFVMIEPGNTVFERIAYLYDGRPMNGNAPRVFLFPSTATNQSLLNAQRTHISMAAIGTSFWFLIGLFLIELHARHARRRYLHG